MSFPKTFQAIAIDKQGGIDVLQKKTLPFPTQAPGDIIVKVAYAGVNFIDTYHRNGTYQVGPFPAKIVLDNEQFKKRGFKIGSKVAVIAFGSHGEYASVPWLKVCPVPENVSLLTAGAALLQGLTALTFVNESYNVKKGDYVFIHTIAGGLGLIFSQLAKHRGAVVIGTTSSPEKAEVAKANGADFVILYPVENVVERVLEITNGEGVHVVYDGVGKDTFLDDLKLARRKGTVVIVGAASGPVEPVSPLQLMPKNLTLLRPSMITYIVTPEESLYYGTELFSLISSGVLKIKVHKEYPFTTEGAQDAQRDLSTRSGNTIGKLVIKIAEN
ncbi:NAD-P-binding protein [Amylocystis lapponica]|nr:NAD-P-binding protein [Amylocystis lapponica]